MSDTKPKALLEQAGRDMAGAVSVRLCTLGTVSYTHLTLPTILRV